MVINHLTTLGNIQQKGIFLQKFYFHFWLRVLNQAALLFIDGVIVLSPCFCSYGLTTKELLAFNLSVFTTKIYAQTDR